MEKTPEERQRLLEEEVKLMRDAATRQQAREEELHQARLQQFRLGAATLPSTADEPEPEGNTPPEVQSVFTALPGLPRAQIVRIFEKKFIPENLYKLRHLYNRDDERPGVLTISSSGDFQIQRVKGQLKDFGNSSLIWSQGFINYAQAMTLLFGASHSWVPVKLLAFHSRIVELCQIYSWQTAVLPLAIDFHTDVIAQGHLKQENWSIPEQWVYRYCHPGTVRPARTETSKTSKTPGSSNRNNQPNDETVICSNFNGNWGCKASWCKRAHKCSKCNATTHGAPTCTQ